MEAIVLCFLDTAADVTQRALIGLVLRSTAKGKAELVFIGDEMASAAEPKRSVIAIRLHRWADADRFLEEVRALSGVDSHAAAGLHTQLLNARQATIENTPLGPMFP